jgi:hypothetical protein
MRRSLIGGLIIAAVLAAPATANAAPTVDRWHGRCSGWWLGENLNTPAKFLADRERSVRMMQRLVICAFATWAPGEGVTALVVADRESGFYPYAVSPSGSYLGLFQHSAAYWPGRAAAYLRPAWFTHNPAHWTDPRAQAIVSARMVAAGGWGPWL